MKWAALTALIGLLIYVLWQQTQSDQGGSDASSGDTGFAPFDWGSGNILDSISGAATDLGDAITGRSADAVVSVWADAIQQHEGFYPGSRSYRNNNPGNIRGVGDAGTDAQGFRIYSSYAAGRAALEADLRAKLRLYPSDTILQIMSRYAPASDGNNVQAYAAAVASALGVSTDTTLGQLVG